VSEKYYCPSCNQFFDDRFEAVTFDNRCSDCNAPVVIMANNGGRHIVKIVSELRRSLADKNKEMETMIHVSLYDEMCEMKDKEIERLRGIILKAWDFAIVHDYQIRAAEIEGLLEPCELYEWRKNRQAKAALESK